MTRFPRILMMSAALAALGACTNDLDWDLRGLTGGGLDTSGAALQATQDRPKPDARGVLSYPGYQVALAQNGDNVASVARRLGLNPDELARQNALKPTDSLRAGEVLALPSRVAAAPATTTGTVISGSLAPAQVDVTTLASGAIDRSASTGTPPVVATKPTPVVVAAEQPARHRVKRGETAYSIARTYNVSARALAEWNGLGPNLELREGQYLLIPVAAGKPVDRTEPVTVPGQGTPTPVPPSAAQPLPDEATKATSAKIDNLPKSPELGKSRTKASAAAFGMPVSGSVIRSFAKGKNDGIDIAAKPGTPVSAAADGTVAAITKDTDQVPVLVLRHANNVLSVYAGIDNVKVTKGAQVKRGQAIAVVRQANPSFVHFEVRKGVEAVDPMSLLQ